MLWGTRSALNAGATVGKAALQLGWEPKEVMEAVWASVISIAVLKSKKFTAEQMADIGLSIDQDLVDAVAFADASPYPAPEEALEDVFAA